MTFALTLFSTMSAHAQDDPPSTPAVTTAPAEDPPTPAIYNAMKALAETGEWDTVRARLAEVHPRRGEHKIYAWTTWVGAAELARASSDRDERLRAWGWALDACDHLGDEQAGTRNRAIARIALIADIAVESLEAARALATQTLEDLGESNLVTDVHFAIGLVELQHRQWGRAEAAIHAATAAAAEDDFLDRATAAGLRGLYALDLGRIEIAAVEFADEERYCRELGLEKDSHRQAKRRSVRHLLKLYLATDRARLLEHVIDETLAIAPLTENAPAFRAELELYRGVARMAEERLGATFDPSAEQIFTDLAADPLTPIDVRQASLLRLAHTLTDRQDFAGASAALEALPFAPKELDRGYAAVLRARILRAEGRDDRDVLTAAMERLDLAWAEIRASLSAVHAEEGDDLPGGDLSGGDNPGSADSAGSGILHYERVRLLHSERIETALALAATNAALPADQKQLPAYRILAELGTLGELHRRFAAPEPALDEVRDILLPPRGGIALFFPAADRSHLVLVDEDQVTHHSLPPRDAIERSRRALDRFHGEVPPAGTEPSPERRTQYEELARALGAQLFPAEVEARISEWEGIACVGLDLLRLFPVAELRLTNGQTLGNEISISALPSLSVGLALAQRRAARGRAKREKVILVAAPTLAPATEHTFPLSGRLSLKPAEGRRPIAAHRDAQLLSGPDATWKRTVEAVDDKTGVLQLLLHGARDPENLGSTALLFAGEPGIIGTEELRQLAAPPLVLATACGSGLGAPRLGDPGSADLMGAFLLSGADAVVISIGDLSYRATLEGSRIVQEALAEGSTPAGALRELHRQGAKLDPAHRSSLIVFGLGHEPVIAGGNAPGGIPGPGGKGPLSLSTVLAVLAVLIAWLVFRRGGGNADARG